MTHSTMDIQHNTEVGMFSSLGPALSSLSIPLRIEMPDIECVDLSPEPRVTLKVLDPTLLDSDHRPSLDELARAYVEKRIEIDGPIMEVVAIADRLSQAFGIGTTTAAAGERRLHAQEQDATAIACHHDLATDFFRLWLDPEMVYSCAYFETGRESLAAAQLAKLRHVCRKLRLAPGEYLLDLGCGWGALARLAAREFGVKVLGITLSSQQLDYARDRIRAEKLQRQVQVELMDYRELPDDGRFDKIASIGMFEHGQANLELYFRRLHDALRPGGLVMNHGITARHSNPEAQWQGGGAEFIHRYVFPQGEIPHLSLAVAKMSDAGLEVAEVENLRPHYARTLECWSAGLERHLLQARRLMPETALRIWRIYLAGCAYAFRRGRVQIHQMLAVKARPDGSHELPWSRRDINAG